MRLIMAVTLFHPAQPLEHGQRLGYEGFKAGGQFLNAFFTEGHGLTIDKNHAYAFSAFMQAVIFFKKSKYKT